MIFCRFVLVISCLDLLESLVKLNCTDLCDVAGINFFTSPVLLFFNRKVHFWEKADAAYLFLDVA